ncbi:low choriolytic enzyme-like protein [Corchorus olitorius]|uniref:Low choriolytic enzyme-like protein n=1 Tax=Corchorus olitorius TaxID=93759 RepID=A0A1R3HW72_9ROSI|nr:low choriolytic enzyme-like protein [Corchorus olitorius]
MASQVTKSIGIDLKRNTPWYLGVNFPATSVSKLLSSELPSSELQRASQQLVSAAGGVTIHAGDQRLGEPLPTCDGYVLPLRLLRLLSSKAAKYSSG